MCLRTTTFSLPTYLQILHWPLGGPLTCTFPAFCCSVVSLPCFQDAAQKNIEVNQKGTLWKQLQLLVPYGTLPKQYTSLFPAGLLPFSTLPSLGSRTYSPSPQEAPGGNNSPFNQANCSSIADWV